MPKKKHDKTEPEVLPPILRTSERTTFKRCQQKWWWAWREGLRTTTGESDALWLGTGVHEALAQWYCGPALKRGPEPAETFAAWAEEELRMIKIEQVIGEEIVTKYEDGRNLGIAMLEGYRKHYGADEHMSVISPEWSGQMPVPWPKDQALYDIPENSGPMVLYAWTFDLVYRDLTDDRIYLGEHKTAATISTGHLSLDEQAGSYWALAGRSLRDRGLINDDDELAGIMYNFLRKGLPDDRPQDAEGYYTNLPLKKHYVEALSQIPTANGFERMSLADLKTLADHFDLTVIGERSKTQPAPLFLRHPVYRTRQSRRTTLLRIQTDAFQMRTIKDGLVPMTKTPARDCERFCDYFEMCNLQDEGSDLTDIKDTFVAQDPYAAHRKSASEGV